MTEPGRRSIYGPEPWRTKRRVVWSNWDLWFCVVALADHDGDLDALVAAIEDRGGTFLSGTVEAKLSHLDDLRLRLTEARIDAAALAGDAGADPRVRGKARTKVLKQGLYPRDLTDAMRRMTRCAARRATVSTSGRCAAAGIGSRSRPHRSTSDWRTGSARVPVEGPDVSPRAPDRGRARAP